MEVKLRVKSGRCGPVEAAGEEEESPHGVRPGVKIGGRAWGHSPETSGHLTGETVMADGPVASFQNHRWTLDHHMRQVKERTIWKLCSFEGDSL